MPSFISNVIIVLELVKKMANHMYTNRFKINLYLCKTEPNFIFILIYANDAKI